MLPKEIIQNYGQRFWQNYDYTFEQFFTNLGQDWQQHLPYMHTIEVFCARLQTAITKNHKICIYSDYDTDAITATAVMYWGLIELGVKKENLGFYAPDRFTEGYGMNTAAARELSKNHDLIITVDCGINSRKEADIISKAGKDLIITDHHGIIGDLPNALAVINPQTHIVHGEQKSFAKIWGKNPVGYKYWQENKYTLKEGQPFLSKSVTGVGVSFFCILWLAYTLRDRDPALNPRKLEYLLPLVAIGTVADCQSIIEPTNRLLVKLGLRILGQGSTKILGLESLLLGTGLRTKIAQGYRPTSQDLAFSLSPILNSSGRINHANLSIQTLVSTTKIGADKNSKILIETNQNRKQLVKDTLEEVNQAVEEQLSEKPSLIWLQGSWSKGIVGLLASRIVNEYNLPVVVISLDNDDENATASLRSPEGYNFVQAFSQISSFQKAGGHACAAGFTASIENLTKIQDQLGKILQTQKSNLQQIAINKSEYSLPRELQNLENKKEALFLNKNEISSDLLNKIWQLDPFGIDFPLPKLVFAFEIDNHNWMGDARQHLKTVINKSISVVFFNLDDRQKKELETFNANEQQLWVIANPSQNAWRGVVKNDLIVDKFWVLAK
jgi:single-stranded-DNA-specific exonuclease